MGQSGSGRRHCMTLPFLTSIPTLLTTMTDDYDTLSLRNRDVTETLSKKEDFGCNEAAKKFDKLELRNRTVTETLSPVADLGQDQPAETNGASNGAENGSAEFDTLELRNRTVTETLSPVADLGQDAKP